jgi:hypothetical protein
MAMSVNIAFAIAAIFLTLFMRLVLIKANKMLDRGAVSVAEVMNGESQTEINSVTGEERILLKEGFRYIT